MRDTILKLDREPTGASQAVWDENGPHVIWTGEHDGPCIYPSDVGQDDGKNSWAAWIPYTLPEHFDAAPPTDADDWQQIYKNASILGPWGDTYWESPEEAEEIIRGVMDDSATTEGSGAIMTHKCEYPPGCPAPAMPGHRTCQPHYILVSALLGSPDTPAPTADEIAWANRHQESS